MSDWDEMAFSNAFEINPKIGLIKGKEYPFVDMQSLDSGTRSVESHQNREYSGGGSKFQHRDVLLARITPCLENGKIARYWNLSKKDAHGSTELIVIRGRQGITDTDFVYYVVRSPQVHQYAISQMTGTSGRQRVPTDAFDHLTIPIPDLDEQRAIAHILGTLDDKIELNRCMNETLEGIARALFKSWFIDFDPVRAKAEGRKPFGMDQETAALFPDQFEDSELGEIPKGWTVIPLDKIANFLNGLALQKYPPTGTDSIPVIKIAELNRGINEGTSRASNVPDDYIVDDGDVLFSWSGSLELKIWCEGKGALNQHLFKVTSEDYPSWFYYQWVGHHLDTFQKIAAGKATTMGHIQRHHLTETLTVVPTNDVLDIANNIFMPMFDLYITNSANNRILTQVRDNLLSKLISGELRVDPSRFGFDPEGEKVGEV